VDPLSPSIHPPWFFWPGTFAVAAAVVAVRAAMLGRASGRSRGVCFGLAAAPFVALALPVVPMIIGIQVACADGTHFTSFNAIALVFGVVGILAWLGIVRTLYVIAGQSREELERPLGVIGGLLAVGMLVEFVVSSVSLEGYCLSNDPVSLYWHVGVAVGASVLAAAATAGSASLHRSGAT
jgi:uncharacterized membrane protein YidH (DUF202 family)